MEEKKSAAAELIALRNDQRAANLAWFFKTGPGQYGEGDQFLGINVPTIRQFTRKHRDLALPEIEKLLASPWHECRLAAVLILVSQYELGNTAVYRFYLNHIPRINNWDLVDASAPGIVGAHLENRSHKPLERMARSKNLWERRIAVVATLRFVKHGRVETAHKICTMLLSDKHDLIHKAVGWVLRETGKIAEDALLDFLSRHYDELPRTALRYAIERFPPEVRARMLKGDFSVTRTARAPKPVLV